MVISGDDGITFPLMALGADGVVSVVANAYPADFAQMVRLCLDGKYSEARTIHYRYTDIITSMFTEGSPSGVKYYLSEMGMCQHTFRQPVWPVSEGLQVTIKDLMKTVKV